MKTFAGIIIVWIIVFEILAFTAFHYPKSTGWWTGNVILVCANILGFFIVENNTDAAPDKWKVYLPAALMIGLMLLVVIPQASKFNV